MFRYASICSIKLFHFRGRINLYNFQRKISNYYFRKTCVHSILPKIAKLSPAVHIMLNTEIDIKFYSALVGSTLAYPILTCIVDIIVNGGSDLF